MLLIFKCIDVYAGMTCHYPLFTESSLIAFVTCIFFFFACLIELLLDLESSKQPISTLGVLNHNLAFATAGSRQFTDVLTFCLCIAMNMCITFCKVLKGMEATIRFERPS